MERLFTWSDGTHWARRLASATADANLRIDGVNVSFLDSAGRALTLASSTSHAGVWIDDISHNNKNFKCVSVCNGKSNE